MGGNYNFCDCKDNGKGEETNLGIMDEFNNLICPMKRVPSKKDFTFRSQNQNLSIDDYKKNAAVNKIIRAYREYKDNQKNKNTIYEIVDNSNYDNINNSFNKNILREGRNKNKVRFKMDNTENNSFNSSKNKSNNENEKKNIFSEKELKSNENINNNNEIYSNNNNNNSKNNKENNNNSNSYNNNKIFDQVKNISPRKPITYIGNRINDSKEGFGINIWSNEAKYIGYFKNNKAHGYGKFIAGKDIYQGEFENDGASGYGIFDNGDETTYEGYWINDSQETYGIEKWKDGSVYMGEYLKGKKNGIGVYHWPDGTWYEGQWVDNTFDGYGIYYFNNDRTYFGEWKNKKKEGFGEFIWPDRKYIGFYNNDKKNGFGITVWKDGHKAIAGFWKDGKQFGFGKFMNNKKSYFGIWNGNNKVEWFKNDKQGLDYLENNSLEGYKNIFEYNLEEIIEFCYNNDDIENILKEKIYSSNDDNDDNSGEEGEENPLRDDESN